MEIICPKRTLNINPVGGPCALALNMTNDSDVTITKNKAVKK